MMNISKEGIEFLKMYEAAALYPYDDQIGLKTRIKSYVKGATIGFGHLIKESEWSSLNKNITLEEANELLLKDLKPCIDCVNNVIKVPMKQQEFDAMVILCFNIGVSGFSKSSAAKLINDKKASTPYKTLEEAWLSWNKSQGKVMKGLDNRRKSEWQIYTKGIYKRIL